MKKYNSPMLQVVSIKRNDIITSSTETLNMYGDYNSSTVTIGAAGRRFDNWYEGY